MFTILLAWSSDKWRQWLHSDVYIFTNSNDNLVLIGEFNEVHSFMVPSLYIQEWPQQQFPTSFTLYSKSVSVSLISSETIIIWETWPTLTLPFLTTQYEGANNPLSSVLRRTVLMHCYSNLNSKLLRHKAFEFTIIISPLCKLSLAYTLKAVPWPHLLHLRTRLCSEWRTQVSDKKQLCL